ncbi:MAG: extracellular solute-binding protein [Spirochaetales bacterium]|nr:extracellular solute-binding protein [Spirochaetales bacterium]
MFFPFCAQDGDSWPKEVKEFSVFIAFAQEDYPVDGTIFGDWLEQQTKVRPVFQFLKGEQETQIDIMIAGEQYPDIIQARNQTIKLVEAGALIPLDDLIEEHGPNIKKLYGKYMGRFRHGDGHIYYLPPFWPYEDRVARTNVHHAVWIQKAVLKEFGYPKIKYLEEFIELLEKYAQKYPTINGEKTLGFTAMATGWRKFSLLNAPSVLSGHPNDSSASVDYERGGWVAERYYDAEVSYKLYKLYNQMYLKGLYDAESFIMDYDKYLEKLKSGRILGFYDQRWHVKPAQTYLLEQDQDRWFVPLPLVMRGYEEEYEGPIEPQTDQGIGISVACKDPVLIIKYFDFLCREQVMKIRKWGFEGEDYLVNEDGIFYRTSEQIDKWTDENWRIKTYGAIYWSQFCGFSDNSVYSDGNSVNPKYSQLIFYARLNASEKEVLIAYGVKTWYELFKPPDMRRAVYFPLWTASAAMEQNSPEKTAEEAVMNLREKYTPLLISAPAGKYDTVWKEYLAALEKIPDRDSVEEYYQAVIDFRVENWTE